MKTHNFLSLFFIALFGLMLVFSLFRDSNKPYYKDNRVVMGTFAEVVCQDKEAINAAFEEIKKVEKIANNFDPESEVSLLNKNGKLKVSYDMINLIKESVKYYNLSNGAFDITVGPVDSIWKEKIREAQDGKKDMVLPSASEIRKKLLLVGSDKILIDEEKSFVKFLKPGMSVDFGGIAQGYAVDKAVKKLREMGITSAMINLSGDIYCLGKNGNNKWRIGARDPRDSKKISYTLDLENQAVVTSGDYEQFFEVNGKRYSHIIDPRSGYPVDNGVISVTVVSENTVAGDAMSTGIFVLGKEKAGLLSKESCGLIDIKVESWTDGKKIL
ncbi:FAD:protein FMN transferase [bacterium]|nr:FAD:protein FMN transferase [bacterium]